MKRNLDSERQILLTIEASPDDPTERAAYLEGMAAGLDALIDSYWLFDGNADAMIDWLLKTTYS